MTAHGSRTRLAIALLACCVLSLASVATALAKHSHSELTGAQSPAGDTSASEAGRSEASGGASGEAGAGESAAGEATSAPASSSTATAGASPKGGAAAKTSKPDSSRAPTAAGTQTARRKEAPKSRRSHETALKGTGASKSASPSAAEGGEGGAAGTSTSTSEPLTATTAAGAAASVSGANASAASAPSAAVAPASSTPAAGLAGGSTTAAAVSRARRARRGLPASARRHRAAKPTTALYTLAPLGIAAAGASPAASRTRPAGRAPAHTQAAKRHSRPSPLVTTITRIVDVVPLAVRELIAALLALAVLLGLRSRVAALHARRLERQRAQLLEDVGLLQAALLPYAPERLGPVGTSVAYQPADGPGAGGDFYDAFALADGQLAVIVGDVSGHGRQALPHTALVRFTLRAYLEAGLSPRDALQTAGAVLERQLGGAFATVVAATYQPRERVLVYACAGHPPPIVLGVDAAGNVHGALDGAARALAPVTACSSPPIGVGARTGTRQTSVSIPDRALVCFHTDGLTEARVGSELFGTDRLIDALAELAPHATAPALLARVAERADARPDDMAACVLSIAAPTQAPPETAPVVLAEELELDREDAVAARAERFLLACGVQPDALTEAAHAARSTATRAGTAVLTVSYASDAPPEVTVQRERLPQLSTRRANVAVAR